MRISDEDIGAIRSKADIVDIIGRYLPLVKKGRSMSAVCPFHDDHTPSMSVSDEKQIFTCFVCGASGNVFSFVKDYENITFALLFEKLSYDDAVTALEKILNSKLFD